jgi:hypothetical protein
MPRPAWVGARLDIAADSFLPWIAQSRVDCDAYRVAAMACYRLAGLRHTRCVEFKSRRVGKRSSATSDGIG